MWFLKTCTFGSTVYIFNFDGFRMSLCIHCMSGVSAYPLFIILYRVCLWNLEPLAMFIPSMNDTFFLTTSPLKHNPAHMQEHIIPYIHALGNLNNFCKFIIASSTKNSTCRCFVPAFAYHSSLLVWNDSPRCGAEILRELSFFMRWFLGSDHGYLEMIMFHSLGGSTTTLSARR